MVVIYVLELEKGKYYIGKSNDFYFVACIKIGNKQETLNSIEKNLDNSENILINEKLKGFSLMKTEIRSFSWNLV